MLWDQRGGFSHSELCVAKVLLLSQGTEKASDIDIRRRQRVSLDLTTDLYTFSKECLKVVEGLSDPLPQHIS